MNTKTAKPKDSDKHLGEVSDSNALVMPEYSQGVWGDDDCVLSDGMPLTIDEAVGVMNVLTQQLEEEQGKTKNITAALRELMKYTPKERWIGGVENGGYQKTGTAMLRVIEACETALGEA